VALTVAGFGAGVLVLVCGVGVVTGVVGAAVVGGGAGCGREASGAGEDGRRTTVVVAVAGDADGVVLVDAGDGRVADLVRGAESDRAAEDVRPAGRDVDAAAGAALVRTGAVLGTALVISAAAVCDRGALAACTT
jgi:hypothetical protein